KEKEQNGIADIPCDFAEAAVRNIIHHYTKEAGVRSLEREISTVCRKIAKEVVRISGQAEGLDGDDARSKSGEMKFQVTGKSLVKYLGEPKFRSGKKEEKDEIGLTNGLAVTMHGGDLLATEVTVMPGKGKVFLTGKLGDVMQESAQAAMSYVRSRAESLGLERDFYQKIDIHVHLP